MNAEIRRLHAQGLRDPDIARLVGLSVAQVNRRRHRIGLPTHPPHSTRRFPEAQARRLHAQGLVDRAIARKIGMSRESV